MNGEESILEKGDAYKVLSLEKENESRETEYLNLKKVRAG